MHDSLLINARRLRYRPPRPQFPSKSRGAAYTRPSDRPPSTDHRVSRSAGKPDPILAELHDLNRHLDTLLAEAPKP